jgi:hypothetical protein
MGRFQVRIVHMGVEIYLGTYDTVEDAKKARDEVALKLHGEFADIDNTEDQVGEQDASQS